MTHVWDVPVHDSTRVRDVRVAVESAAGHIGLDEERTADAALVATELATNLLKHAGGGQILIDVVDAYLGPAPAGRISVVQIVALDHGPGIVDPAAALGDGYSTASSLGAGLGTCRRIADEFELHSSPGRGTVALARVHGARSIKVPRHDAHTGLPVRAGGVNIPFAGAEVSGDAWAWVPGADRLTLLVADGLGHGPAAALASDAAVRELHRSAHLSPPELLAQLHTALRDTRGAAVAVAQLDLAERSLSFSGIGNIGARLRTGDTWRALLSHPGIVGAHRPARVPHLQVPWAPDSLLVLHSDGLPGRWVPPDAVPHGSPDPAVTAAAIVRDSSSSALPVRDDTTVVVLSPTLPDRRP
ncbi:ATP-binding SpoIIE family protein phosphatase [Streptomyces sp. NPDC005485]|uniref:ATP-binding SpoIIE family protein phosphatase n=1 Tax=Streptomyces sp. NPDC005485 TaxID=3155591 RepID=UPI0033AC6368